jgi:hypothetical protein
VSLEPIAAVERLLVQTEDADEVLRGTVAALVADPAVVWARIEFLEDGALSPGPAAGTPDEARRVAVPIVFQGTLVGELRADGTPDPETLARIAALIAPQVLIGWDTGGEAWEP